MLSIEIARISAPRSLWIRIGRVGKCSMEKRIPSGLMSLNSSGLGDRSTRTTSCWYASSLVAE